MASEAVCGLIFRLLLPFCLAAACLFRYNGLSLVYLIYLLLIPLFPEPTIKTMQGPTGWLLKSLCCSSATFLLFHIVYQITVNSLLAGSSIRPDFNCTLWEKSIRQIGFESVVGADAGNGIRVFIPDIGMFMAGLGTWLLCRRLEQKRLTEEMAQYNPDFEAEDQEEESEEKRDLDEGDDEMLFDEDFDAEDEAEDEDGAVVLEEEEEEEEVEEEKESAKMKVLRIVAGVASKVKEIIGNLITTAGKVVVTILLGVTGMMLPSLTSAVYFFVFLALCTWWSFCHTFDTLLFSCLCVLMAIFSAGHLFLLYLFQFQFFQDSISVNDTYARLFGISGIVKTDCVSTWRLTVHADVKWHHCVNPIMLLILYYTLATLIRLWLQDPIITEPKEEECTENCAVHTADKRRLLWWRAHQRTEEKNLLSTLDGYSTSEAAIVNSNGTSFGYVSTLNSENGPVGLDLYSTPTYKVDQTNDVQDHKDVELYEVVDVPQEEEEEEKTEESEQAGNPGTFAKVFKFIMKQSYVCALIAMMTWSITYVSWLTFVFLLWSCALWMVRDRRKYAMLTSPFMVAYGNLLLVLQYIWSFETLKDVPDIFKTPTVPFSELSSKVLCLLSFWLLLRQTLTERQDKLKEEAVLSEVTVETEKKDEEKQVEEDGMENDLVQVVGKLVMAMLVKYWIYICGSMFFLVSFEDVDHIAMYKVFYMMMFLFCVAMYQVDFERWRRILKYFWMSVVVYTMLVVILIYTCQFTTSVPFWSKVTGVSTESLGKLGLKQFEVTELFRRIFIPTSFLLVCILHLHYFHEHFLELTDIKAVVAKQDSSIYSHAKISARICVIMDRIIHMAYNLLYRLAHPDGSLADLTMMSSSPEPLLKEDKEKEVLVVEAIMEEKKKDDSVQLSSHEGSQQCSVATDPEIPSEQSSDLKSKWHLVVDRLTVLFLKFLEYFHKLQLFIWWLLEMHIVKIVPFYIILVCVKEVSLLNYVLLASWAFALPYRQFRTLASSICIVWTCVIITCKMFYQLETIEPRNYSVECLKPENITDVYINQSLLYTDPVDPANWVGLRKSKELLTYLTNDLLIVAILAFEVTIYRHQEYFRRHNKLSPPPSRTIFHDITRQHLDNGIINCIKYFINYSFYKFGVEVCFLLAVNVIGQRMDFYSMLHAFALAAVMYRRRRKAIAEIWPKYCCFLACMITFQYAMCIGIPPAACSDYPWRFPSSTTNSNVIKWLFLPDFSTRPNSMFLLYDFMLLLSASLQRQVFDEENKAAVRLMAGDNVEICRDLDAASFSVHNPVPDFIHCRSYLDMLKVIMFSYLFWFVLTIIFITGTTRISIFCMGYLVACFYFLLFGGELLLKPIKKLLHYWDFLIAYNVFVITMKNIFSLLACGYIDSMQKNSCWLIQLLSLACTIKEYTPPNTASIPSQDRCDLPKDEAGIIWDSICFSFLLLQRRVFMSYYFLHVVADIRAGQILASRGAELFQASIVKAVRARLEEENKSMEQLKRQMDRIKTRQQKFKKGKEKMLSMTQESGDGQNLIPPEEEDDDDGAEKEKAKAKKKQWWRPWVDHASMVRSGDYYLFETDSEEEEEEEEKKDEEPPKKSAFQRAIGKFASAVLALPRSIIKLPKTILQYIIRAAKFVYHAWVTDSKTALKERRKERRHFWKRYTRGHKHRKEKTEGHVAIEVGEEEQQSTEEKKGPDNIIKRVFNIIKFTWVLFLTTVESLTVWINSVCREYIDISTVLRIERCMLTREVKKGNVPSRESIQVYYQKQLRLNASRESGLDKISEEDSTSGSHRVRRRRRGYTMESQDSVMSRDSMSSAYTEATMLFSRQSTLDDLDDMPHHVPKTSERARPKLRKMYGLDMSNSSGDSCSSAISSEATQCITLFSRQGTNDTIEEAEDEQDQSQAKKESPKQLEEQGPWKSLEIESGQDTEPDQEHEPEQESEPGPDSGPEPEPEAEPEPEQEQELEQEFILDIESETEQELGPEQELNQECELEHDFEPEQEAEDKSPELTEWEAEDQQDEEQCRIEDEVSDQSPRRTDGESSDPDYILIDRGAGQLFTPDTDVPNTSDADVPPSYSKAVSFDRLSISSDESDNDKRLMLMTSDSRSDLDDSLLPSQTTDLTASELLLNKMFYDEELEGSERFYKTQPLGLQLCYALYNLLVAHSEMVSYLVIILNHMISASMVTLVLPILIFLWAMLSVPRPSKRFWMTAIVYTEVTIVIKYFFQFSFFPFNQNMIDRNKPYHPPNIIGVEKKDGYVHYDLIQLLTLFFHRSILKCHGLWDEDDPKAKKKDTPLHREESEDEEKMTVMIPAEEEKKSLSPHSLKSFGMGTSIDSAQVHIHMRYPEHCTYQRRKSSSGTSHLSRNSSMRSKRGSTSTKNSIRRESSEADVQPKTRKELIIEKIREQLIKAKAFLLKKAMEIYLPIRQFFYNLIHPDYSAVTDVYVLMFLADTVDFIIIVFGFWAFGKHQGGADITSSLSEDQVPGPFLVMVLIQFGTMVVDRALYLRKTVMGKVIFQVVLVFGIHFWMFFILPGVTERRFSQNRIAQLWYFVKCIYFGLSAYQIRCGYPTRVLGNFLTKSYNYVNLFLFQGFRLIPFLTELRAVMDWVWTDTTLSLSSWICVEDIYAHIFVLKCWRESEKRYPQPRGQKKKKVVKYGMGGMIVMLLICIVWFPLLFMSLVKSVAGVVNTPLDVSVSLTLGGFQPIFTMSAQQKNLNSITSAKFDHFVKHFSKNSFAVQFLEAYVYQDLTVAHLEGSSNSMWTISPPSKKNLIGMLNQADSDFPLTMTWSIQRNLSLGAKSEMATGKKIINLDKETKIQLAKLLIETNSTDAHKKPVCIKSIFPRYLRAPSDSNAKLIEQLSTGADEEIEYEDIDLFLNRAEDSNKEWWVVNQTKVGLLKLESVKINDSPRLELYIFSDQVSPPSLGFLAGYGIMGLYMSVVLVIGKFVREFFSGISHTIMFEELPNVDRILKLCTDIFLVRETGELDLEEDLYAKLIFLYRSPETMIKWTREKKE
ncbi:piezo-type mechanosensitive ion channel component 2-like isoform X1 [Astyanax mexicanus]|uniref:Piezo-type mechanosensitive ion channel component 2-like isoform X1 n=1 Tax=Astyanax mexicanus TaxID=7994 RepID=A0A8T2M4Q3_ASTMX|nr:piezo-type mechanosensitive ion channel component 2-like isoform X1 [Astyanax mexicanus]